MRCLNCSSNEVYRYCTLPSILFQRNYNIELCKSCGVGFTDPSPSLLSTHYEEATRPEIVSEDILELYKKDLIFIIDAFVAKNGRHPKTFLDVGCGNGLVLSIAKKLGLEVMGIEPSIAMYEFSKAKGLNVTNCYLESFNDYHKYDLIVLNSVIEHLPAPNIALDMIYSNISDESIVVFQQAVFDGLVPRVFRWFWYGWAPSEHFYHYSEISFSKFVENHGFSVIKTNRTNLFYQFYLGSWRTWKTFIYCNTLKLTSLLAKLINQGDSLYVITQRNKSWRK